MDNDFLKPTYESMEVNSAQSNIIAGPSQITVSLPNGRPAWDVLAISAPQLPPKRISRNALGQNLRAVGKRDTAKTHVREWIVIKGIADDPKALSEQD